MPPPSSRYGPRVNSRTGRWEEHKGVDYAVPMGTPIYVNKEMTVQYVGDVSGYGRTMITTDNTGTRYIFGHLDGYPPGVQVNSTLPPGSLVGYAGNTGGVRPSPTAENPGAGSHLHYETQRFNSQTGKWEAFNPETTTDPTTGGRPYINNASFTPNSRPDQSSLESSTPTKDPGYTPRGPGNFPPTTRPPTSPGASNNGREPGPWRGDRAPGTNEQYRDKGMLTNPVLKLGDEWIGS